MSRYESVEKAIYSDPTFRKLSLEASALYLWSFINLRCNLAGLYRVDVESMVDSRVPLRKINGALGELHERQLVRFDDDLMWVCERIRYLPQGGPKVAAGIAREVAVIQSRHPLRVAFLYHHLEQGATEFEWLREHLEPLNGVPHKAVMPPERVVDEVPQDGVSIPLHVSTYVSKSSSSKPLKEQRAVELREDVETLCALLADLIEGNGSKRPPVTDRWRTECRLMLDRDGRFQAEVAAVIRWCQADSFWKANVMSMPKLRDQYDQLRLKMEAEGPPAAVKDFSQYNRKVVRG